MQSVKDYAKKLLIDYGCKLDCYRNDYDNALKDINYTIADGSVHPFSAEEIAIALVEIGKEQPVS